jgi:hypothetical protein
LPFAIADFTSFVKFVSFAFAGMHQYARQIIPGGSLKYATGDFFTNRFHLNWIIVTHSNHRFWAHTVLGWHPVSPLLEMKRHLCVQALTQ